MGYWEYYPKSTPRAVRDGIKAKSTRGDIGETWWSKRFIDILESFDIGARISRGRNYARRGQVISVDVSPGEINARVQGSQAKPYSVTIKVKPLSEQEWGKVESAMASKAIFAAKLLAGEMPRNIEEAFSECKVSLLPMRQKDLDSDCSCPDWSNPCKHVAAVYYILAEMFDSDPFLIFKLRGKDKEDLMRSMKRLRLEKPPVEEKKRKGQTRPEKAKPLAITVMPSLDLDKFWNAGPELGSVRSLPRVPEVEFPVMKRLGPAPEELGSEFSDNLMKAYVLAGYSALKKAMESKDGGERGLRR